MVFQSVPETAEADTIYVQNNETIQMTWYAQFVGGYSQADINILAANVNSAVVSFLLPIQTIDTVYSRTEVRGLESIDDLQASNSAGAGPGGSADTGLPNQVTYAVQRNSGLTGRSSRGRIYWIGLTKGALSSDENFLNPVDALAIVAAVVNVRSLLAADGWSPVIVSRFTGGVKRAEGVTFPWVNTLAIDERVDTLRGRLP